MDAELLLRERHALTDTAFVELVVWKVPEPVLASTHSFKYRLALVSEGVCLLRYDNEAGKGDHMHVGEFEQPYRFIDLVRLQSDFWMDVEAWRSGR